MNVPTDAPIPRPRLAPLLRRVWYGLNQTFRRRIAETGVTPDQFTILRWLTEHPEGLTQRAIADLMASDPNTVTAILARMLTAGLIERRPDADDARCNRIRLKPKGRTLHARLQPLANALQDELLAGIPAQGRDALLAHLASVAESLEAIEAEERRRSTTPRAQPAHQRAEASTPKERGGPRRT
jgi:DNA-binding MarR family transcriptional regulator